ncbi:uncharacterized protein [Prorops nasuta]|uniref:uncharacterized protein n=1 Tax=Prorops nasuta TaxID=863751 RepID=UPI0034CD4B56
MKAVEAVGSRCKITYRSWLERTRKERPAFLSIVSLELPEAPVPLVESLQRCCDRKERDRRDEILDELLEKVTEATGRRKIDRENASSFLPRPATCRRDPDEALECRKKLATLEECTRRIIEGPRLNGCSLVNAEEQPRERASCICSEIPEQLRVDVRRKRSTAGDLDMGKFEGARRSLGMAVEYREDGKEIASEMTKAPGQDAGAKVKPRASKKTGVTLDLTLNCTSLRLSSRDAFERCEQHHVQD